MADTPCQRPEDTDSFSLNRRELLMGAGGVLLAGSLAACGSGSSSSSTASTATGTPKKGGNFRLAVTGGGAKDIMDGQSIITKPDQARLMTAFETLLVYDTNYILQPHLAEEVTQNKPDQWTIVLKKGIEFQNGKTLTADDVVYSLQRILNPKLGLFGTSGFASLKPSGIKKLNTSTVQLNLSYADAGIGEQLGQYYNGIVPEGYAAFPAPQHGTGGYILKSLHPGPAERAHAQPELLAVRQAVLRPGDDHRLRRPGRPGERPPGRPGGRHDRPPVQQRAGDQGAFGAERAGLQDRAAGCPCAWPST